MKNGCYIVVLICFFYSAAVSQPLLERTYNYQRTVTIASTIQTNTHSIVACGKVGTDKAIVFTIDSAGGQRWATEITLDNQRITLSWVAERYDGSIITGGWMKDDTKVRPVIILLSSMGKTLWVKTLNFSKSVTINSGYCDSNGQLLLVGNFATETSSTTRGLILAVDSLGSSEWCNITRSTLGSPQFTSISKRPDGRYLVAGSSVSTIYLLDISTAGAVGTVATYTLLNNGLFKPTILTREATSFFISCSVGSVGSEESGALVASFTDIIHPIWGKVISEPFPISPKQVWKEPTGGVGLLLQRVNFESLPDALVECDPDGQVISVANYLNEKNPQVSPTIIKSSTFPSLRMISTSSSSTTPRVITVLEIDSIFNSCHTSQTLLSAASAEIVGGTLSFPFDTLMPISEDLFFTSKDIVAQTQTICTLDEVAAVATVQPLLRVYPNPARSGRSLQIIVDRASYHNYQLVLRDLLGVEWYRSEYSSPTEDVRLPTQGLPAGMYIVEAVDEETHRVVASEKVVVE